jgi:hypothetical protein
MAWSPAVFQRRITRVSQPGDYAAFPTNPATLPSTADKGDAHRGIRHLIAKFVTRLGDGIVAKSPFRNFASQVPMILGSEPPMKTVRLCMMDILPHKSP